MWGTYQVRKQKNPLEDAWFASLKRHLTHSSDATMSWYAWDLNTECNLGHLYQARAALVHSVHSDLSRLSGSKVQPSGPIIGAPKECAAASRSMFASLL